MTVFDCHNLQPLAASFVKLIRGESRVFVPPPGANGEVLPTDHHQMLKLAVYPMSNVYSIQVLKNSLEHGLVCSASDELGVFCSVQCYYAQIVSETFNQSPFEVDRNEVPLILGTKLKKMTEGLINLRLKESDPPGLRLKLAEGLLRLMSEKYRIFFATGECE